MNAAEELVPGVLYRVGGTVPIDGRLSWRAEGAVGFEPISAFLLFSGDNALLIGTGVRLHRAHIIEQIRSVLGNRTLHIYADRNEADEIGNLAALVTEFDVLQIWFAGAGHLLKWFEFEEFGGSAPTEPTINFLMPLDNPGRELIREFDRPSEVAFDDNQQLLLMNTRLTVLGFSWLYDASTKTLFSSDFFSEGTMAAPTDSVVTPAAEIPSIETVREHIHTRFYWMKEADTAPLLDDLDKVFSTCDIERIAPYHGCVISGRDQVAAHLALARNVLSGNSIDDPSGSRAEEMTVDA